MFDQLIDDILGYMKNTNARYAIALEGDWGSGKTRFCESTLKEVLYEEGYSILRISLLGINDLDNLYTRLAMALVHLGNSETTAEGASSQRTSGPLSLKGESPSVRKCWAIRASRSRLRPKCSHLC